MRRASTFKRAITAAYALAVVIWIGACVGLQWILLMSPSALRFESATTIPIFNSTYWVRAHLSKPLSPPRP
jgi:hypothetical protein